MSCYVIHVSCYVILYNICHVMLDNIKYVMLGPNRTRARQIKNCLFYVKNLSTLDLS